MCFGTAATQMWEQQQQGVQFAVDNTNAELKVGGEVATVLTLVSAQHREKYTVSS